MWSLATVLPNCEERASRVLSDLEVDHRMFMVSQRAVKAGKVVEILKLAFPGYVFIDRVGPLPADTEAVSGISGFVRFGDGIVDATRVVADLEAEADNLVLGRVRRKDFVSRFVAGDRIRITAGVASGLNGQFHQMISGDRAIVLLEFMGRHVPFTVDEFQIEIEHRRAGDGKGLKIGPRSRDFRRYEKYLKHRGPLIVEVV